MRAGGLRTPRRTYPPPPLTECVHARLQHVLHGRGLLAFSEHLRPLLDPIPSSLIPPSYPGVHVSSALRAFHRGEHGTHLRRRGDNRETVFFPSTLNIDRIRTH